MGPQSPSKAAKSKSKEFDMSEELNMKWEESFEQVLSPRRILTITESLASMCLLKWGTRVESTALANASLAVKATPAQKVLCAIGDWPEKNAVFNLPFPSGQRSWRPTGISFCLQYAHDCVTGLTLRATGADLLELQTLISYPDRRGNGAATMRRLCGLADELGVRIWLDAFPFGRGRTHIPQEKLLRFYRNFGFSCLPRIDPAWVNDYHRWDSYRFHSPMLRHPASTTR